MRRAPAYLGAVLVPLGAGLLLHLWAGWSMRSPVRVPTLLAALAGLALTGVALLAHNALFREGGSIVAVVLLVAGLVAVWVEAGDSRVRAAVVGCEITGTARATYHPTFGEGAPSEMWLYHHPLDCPGGYPSEFTAEERIGAAGKKVRVAYDPARRMDPILEKDNVAHGSPVLPSVLLALSVVFSLAAVAAEEPALRGRDA
ncbi:hypothetical protein ACFY7C_10365 [Streptomyces sp. NPDC012769]|uniref:hypothetical protein n=1 Tax=Streptomyces sp. NPDC012769 TaxID=3364848 RepID=UPI0036C66C7D